MMNSLVLKYIIFGFLVSTAWNYDLFPKLGDVRKYLYQTGSGLKIDEQEITRAMHFAKNTVKNLKRLEQNLVNARIGNHKIVVSNADKMAVQIGKQAMIMVKASTQLISHNCHKNRNPASKCVQMISEFNVTEHELNKLCVQLHDKCKESELMSKYRSFDGGCNHKNAHSMGEAFTPYLRLALPEYLDGLDQPRRSVNKKFAMPSPRAISNALIQRENDHDTNVSPYTLAFAHWGELIEHDMAQSVTNKMIHFDRSIECCTCDGKKLAPRYLHPFCHAIQVPNDDKFFANRSVNCLSYVRSIGSLHDDCSFGSMDQLNQATHYLDASNIYGNYKAKSSKLRNGNKGQLRISDHKFLPTTSNKNTGENPCREDNHCYEAGDGRVSSHLQLTTLHTIILREHNRLAKKLSKLNPQWYDEKLFQEARRIVIAQIQHITYNEWLPLLLPKDAMKQIMLTENYVEVTDPSVSNSFATATIRFLKSMIPGNVQLFNENRVMNGSLKLRAHTYKTNIIESPGMFDSLVRGLVTQKSRKLDLKYTKDLIDWMDVNVLGVDVISLDIQRGRDHGLPSYNAMRSLCGLPRADTFDDLNDFIPMETVRKLSDVYYDPNDIDLIIGGLAEMPLDESQVVGPTIACVITDQFRRTRLGDRYFYTFAQQTSSFTQRQLKEIKRVTLAKLLCNNADVKRIQPQGFLPITHGNMLTKCNEIPDLDLNKWKG